MTRHEKAVQDITTRQDSHKTTEDTTTTKQDTPHDTTQGKDNTTQQQTRQEKTITTRQDYHKTRQKYHKTKHKTTTRGDAQHALIKMPHARPVMKLSVMPATHTAMRE
jgi:hypothetical protein